MQLHLDINRQDLKAHGTWSFPVNVSFEQLSRYERKSFLWHWHKEIELTILLQGEMQYQVNDTVYHLTAGEGIFCNSNSLHTASPYQDSDCIYISTTFHPRFLYGYEGSVLQSKYLDVITKHPGIHGLAFSPSVDWQREILEELTQIWELSQHPSSAYEMELQWRLTHIWMLLWSHLSHEVTQTDSAASRHTARDRPERGRRRAGRISGKIVCPRAQTGRGGRRVWKRRGAKRARGLSHRRSVATAV